MNTKRKRRHRANFAPKCVFKPVRHCVHAATLIRCIPSFRRDVSPALRSHWVTGRRSVPQWARDVARRYAADILAALDALPPPNAPHGAHALRKWHAEQRAIKQARLESLRED